MFAVEAFAAGCGEGGDYQVALLERGYGLANFGDSAGEFVAHDEVGL